MAKKKEEAGLVERLREHGLAPLYLIEGKEAFLRARAVADLREFAQAGNASAPVEARFEGGKAELASVLDETRTLPFLASMRIVHVSEADELILRDVEAFEKALDELAARKAPTKCALVLETEGLDGRLRISKRVREVAHVIACDAPDEAGLLRFVRERARSRGRSFAPGADSALLDRFGGGAGVQVDLGILDGEVAKLCSGSDGAITLEQVTALASSLSAEDTFAVVGAVGRGDVRGALESLRAVFRDGAVVDGERKRDPRGLAPMLLGLLAWDLGRVFKGRSLLDQGRTAQDVISEVKAWRDKDAFIARVRGSSAESLRRAHALLREADAQLKDSGDAVEIMTALVARLALMGPRPRAKAFAR